MGVCTCYMFCCTLLYVHSSIATILMGKRELVALLNLTSWCLVMVEQLFLAVPRGCLWFAIVVFPDHTHLLVWNIYGNGNIPFINITENTVRFVSNIHSISSQIPYVSVYKCAPDLVILTLKATPIICSRRQFQILLLFQK